MPLHPKIKSLLNERNSSVPNIDYTCITAPELRQLRERPLFSSYSDVLQRTEMLRIEQRSIPVRSGEVGLRLYFPSTNASKNQPRPITLFFHGGGFCLGNLDSYDSVCRLLALYSGSIVASVEFRLAPESKFPAALEDAEDSLLWVSKNAVSFGGDVSRLAVAGSSSGANLAAVTAKWAHDQGIVLKHQLLMFPVTDASHEAASYSAFAEGYLLTASQMRWFWRNYLNDLEQASDPRVSPLLQQNLKGLAPATVFTAEYDVLRDEGEAYASALECAGVPVKLKRWKGLIHVFILMIGYIEEADAALQEAGAALNHSFRRK